jgi:hypothetical protein
MQMNRQTVLQKQIEQNIVYEFMVKEKNEALSVLLKHTINHENFPENLGNTLDVSEFLNIPYENLHLKLYPNGEVKDVLNQDEIAEKWEQIKNRKEFHQLLEYIDEEQFFRKLNPAYEDSLEYILKTPHYIVFFPPVYQTPRYHPDPFVRVELNCNSIIFAGNTVDFRVQFELERIENGFAYCKSKTLKFSTNERKMKNLYKQGYASAIQSPLEYAFSYEAQYKYEVKTAKLIQANAVFKEQANENLIYENQINIQLKSTES